MGAIEEAIALAKAKSAEAATTAVATTPSQSTGGAVAHTNPAGTPAPLTMETMMLGSMSVDHWLKVSEDGLKLGDSPLIETLMVAINMTEVALAYGLRYGNPPIYEKTYDRVTSAAGGSWADTLASAKRVDPSVREYRMVDIPMTLIQPVKNLKGETLDKFVVGSRVGYSTSVTNWKNYESFYREVAASGLVQGTVMVELTAEKRDNTKNTWGVVAFKLLGELPEEEEVAQAA